MADIFISYAREDEATAIHLRDVLVEQGWDIWRDREGILTGTSWEQSIEKALNEAKCVIVLWSSSALSSHFVRDEASVARNAGKLVPVQIDSVEIPLGFRGIQTSNLVGWDGTLDHPEFRKLIRALEERVGAHTPRPPTDTIIKRRIERDELDKRAPVRTIVGAARKLAELAGLHWKNPWILASTAGVVLFLAGFAVGHGAGNGHSEKGHAALETGLRNFFDGKYAEADRDLTAAASSGNGFAAFYLFRMYREALGVKNDDAVALEWARKGAEQGNASAQNAVGYMMDLGKGTKTDSEGALKWYIRAADQGLANGAFNAGYLYDVGRGTDADPGKAFAYYRRAWEEGWIKAAFSIGDLFINGRGVRRDPVAAVQWYRLGADRGDARAQNRLGYLYGNAIGVERDDVKAVEWYRRAADQNFADATNNLGFMYENGRGVPLDLNQAAYYYQRAVTQGNAAAQANLARIRERLRMTPPRR